MDGSAYLRHREGRSVEEEPLDPSLRVLVANLEARHFFGAGWSADLQLPVASVDYDQGTGRGHARVAGFGDLQLGLRYDFAGLWGTGPDRPAVSLRAGLGLPTARREETLPAGAISPVLLGTGFATFSAQAQLFATQFITRTIAVQGALWLAAPLGRTPQGLRPGVQLGYALGALWFVDEAVAVSGRVAGRWIERADEEEVGTILRSGGRELAAELDIGWRATDRLALVVRARAPFYQFVNQRQIVESFTLGAGVGVSFGGEEEEEHEHGDEHEHGRDHDHGGGGDVAVLARGGASFEAADTVVQGKLTVVDFWAEWCAPCKFLSEALAHLASEEPRLAVRTVEVPDFDAEVAKVHLEGVDKLPTVWLVHPDGRREVLAGQPPDVILDAVRAALSRAPGAPADGP